MSHEKFKSCIDACLECATVCEHCASACLGEIDVRGMVKCIQLDRYCADLCRLAATFMSVSFVVYALRSVRIVHRSAVCILQIIVKNALKHAANVPLNVKTWLIDPA